MNKNVTLDIVSNERIARDVYKMVLSGDNTAITKPGQFINIMLDGFYLRRPISVCDLEGDRLTIIYKAVGQGTNSMSLMKSGRLDVLSGLGNGFDISKSGEKPLLVGGGVGVPPLYLLARKLLDCGKTPTVLLGFNSSEDIFCVREFEALGLKVILCTADGSSGIKGFVTDGLKNAEYDYTYACGPIPMLRALYDTVSLPGQFSFEERMGCGFGACMGCSCKTKYGNKRICKDGPVLERDEIIW